MTGTGRGSGCKYVKSIFPFGKCAVIPLISHHRLSCRAGTRLPAPAPARTLLQRLSMLVPDTRPVPFLLPAQKWAGLNSSADTSSSTPGLYISTEPEPEPEAPNRPQKRNRILVSRPMSPCVSCDLSNVGKSVTPCFLEAQFGCHGR